MNIMSTSKPIAGNSPADLDRIAKDPVLSEKALDHMISGIQGRVEVTANILEGLRDGRELPTHLQCYLNSSSLKYLSGRHLSVSIRGNSEKGPSTETPDRALFLLGTEQSTMARKKLESFFLAEDQRLGSLRETHFEWRSGHEKSKLEKQFATFRDGQGKTDYIKNSVQKFRNGFTKMTSQGDVKNLADRLLWNSTQNPEVLDKGRAQTETAQLLTDLLPQIADSDNHKHLADLALGLIDQADYIDPGVKGKLRKTLTGIVCLGQAS